MPAALNRSNCERHKSAPHTGYKAFGRSHYTLGQPGWEEVADYAHDWCNSTPAAAFCTPGRPLALTDMVLRRHPCKDRSR